MDKLVHERRAVEAFSEENETAVVVNGSARQGDLIIERIGDCVESENCSPTPDHGIVLISGEHGEHRIIASRCKIEKNEVVIPDGGVIVHTDVPSSRHRAIKLVSGVWIFRRQRQLSVDGVIEDVSD